MPPGPAVAASFADVAVAPDGFVVVGGGGPIGLSAMALHSSDGVTWTNEAINSRFAAPGALTVDQNRVIGIGGGQTDRCAHPAALDTWVRDPPGTWTEAPFDPLFCAGIGNAVVVRTGDRLALMGAGTGDQGIAWTSGDGLHWTDTGRNPFGDLYPRSVVAHGADVWVFGSAPDGRLAMIHRTGGEPFDPPIGLPGLGSDASLVTAFWSEPGPVAMVSVGRVAGLLRPDGAGSWTPVEASGLPADEVTRIEVVSGHLVALGLDAATMPRMWGSADGSSWVSLPLPPDARAGTSLSGIAATQDTAVLVGQTTAPDGSGAIGAIWTGPATLLSTP